MSGSYTSTDEGVVLEGFWDEKKATVNDPTVRNPKKTFKYVVSKMPTPVASNDEDEGGKKPPPEKAAESNEEEDEDEEGVIKDPNCVGGFYGLAADGSGFEHFEDDMMLRTYPEHEDDEEDGDDEETGKSVPGKGPSKSSSLMIKAVGWNSGGFFRMHGTATGSSGSSQMTLALMKEYMSEDAFDEEAIIFDRGLAGYDNDDGHIRVYYEGNTYLVPQDEPLVYSVANPRPETNPAAYWRYEMYKGATTVGEACDKKASSNFEFDMKAKVLAFKNATDTNPLPSSATKLDM